MIVAARVAVKDRDLEPTPWSGSGTLPGAAISIVPGTWVVSPEQVGGSHAGGSRADPGDGDCSLKK